MQQQLYIRQMNKLASYKTRREKHFVEIGVLLLNRTPQKTI